jgi:amino acid adenylation domain-containing protein
MMITNMLTYLEETAHRFPSRIAISDDKSSLTFAEWENNSRSIATAISISTFQALRKPVLVFVDRSIECVVGFMGVMQSGNFYVPIDCKMPFERVRIISEVLSPIAAITVTKKDEQTLDQIDFNGIRLQYEEVIKTKTDNTLLASISNQIIDTDPAYCIFTSGSTGIPKGVLISQRSMIDLTEWLVNTFHFTEQDAIGNQTPFYFDGSVKDICICLKSGATLNVIGKKYFSFPKLIVPYLNSRRITAILWATSAIVLIGNSDILSRALPEHLRLVTFAGEAMPAKQLKVWMDKLPCTKFVNLYGPTEITVDCTYYQVEREFNDDEFIPIGKACKNMQILVFNNKNQLVQEGEPGELCVRGTGVALGYYNNKAKTDEVFVQNPLHDLYNDKIYRTGDIVKYNERGELVFISRKDFQIKHKGNRIEMGEIEVAVNSIPTVTNAACIFDKPNDKIVLFYTTADCQELDIINLVKEKIPVYMFPEIILLLEQMPYNINGKIDRIELKRMYEVKQG